MNCLRGKRVGFIGFGSIAQATAELCRALRMRLVAHCRRAKFWSINSISRWWFQTILYFHPYLGKIPNLTNIFQMDWNHQLVYLWMLPPGKRMPSGHQNDRSLHISGTSGITNFRNPKTGNFRSQKGWNGLDMLGRNEYYDVFFVDLLIFFWNGRDEHRLSPLLYCWWFRNPAPTVDPYKWNNKLTDNWFLGPPGSI